MLTIVGICHLGAQTRPTRCAHCAIHSLLVFLTHAGETCKCDLCVPRPRRHHILGFGYWDWTETFPWHPIVGCIRKLLALLVESKKLSIPRIHVVPIVTTDAVQRLVVMMRCCSRRADNRLPAFHWPTALVPSHRLRQGDRNIPQSLHHPVPCRRKGVAKRCC